MDGAFFATANPLSGDLPPAPMRMEFEPPTDGDKRPPLEQLSAASGQSTAELVELGDEDLLMLMEDHSFLGLAAKNAILVAVTNARDGGGADMAPPPDGFAVGTLVQGLYPNGTWYNATVNEVNAGDENMYTLDWEDGDQAHRQQPAASVRARGAARNDGDHAEELARRMEEHRQAKKWLKRPKDAMLQVHKQAHSNLTQKRRFFSDRLLA